MCTPVCVCACACGIPGRTILGCVRPSSNFVGMFALQLPVSPSLRPSAPPWCRNSGIRERDFSIRTVCPSSLVCPSNPTFLSSLRLRPYLPPILWALILIVLQEAQSQAVCARVRVCVRASVCWCVVHRADSGPSSSPVVRPWQTRRVHRRHYVMCAIWSSHAERTTPLSFSCFGIFDVFYVSTVCVCACGSCTLQISVCFAFAEMSRRPHTLSLWVWVRKFKCVCVCVSRYTYCTKFSKNKTHFLTDIYRHGTTNKILC